MARISYLWLTLAVLGVGAAVARTLLANHAMTQGDPLVAGQGRPSSDSPVIVESEKLSIDLAPPAGAEHNSFGTLRAKVRAEYQLKNPTAQGQQLPLAFPIFHAGMSTEDSTWFAVMQDGKPLAAQAQSLRVGAAEDDLQRQRAWVKRLDDWASARADLLPLIRQLRADAAGAALNDAHQALDDALGKRFTDTMPRYAALRILEASDPKAVFDEVVRLLPFVDEEFRVIDAGRRIQPILHHAPESYAAHQGEWTQKALAKLAAFDELTPLVKAYRQAATTSEAQENAFRTLEALLGSKYQLTPEAAQGVAAFYSRRSPGDPVEPIKTVGMRFDAAGAAQQVPTSYVPVVLPASLAGALWPDVAAELEAQAKAQDEQTQAWGGDERLLSPLSGRLYARPPGEESHRALEAWLADKDSARTLIRPPHTFERTEAATLLRYSVSVPANGQATVTVEYESGLNYDQRIYMTQSYAVISEFSYVLETVAAWKSFGPIALTITAPASTQLVTAPELESPTRTGARQTITGTLKNPRENLRIALLQPDRSSEAIWEMLPADDATLARLQALQKSTTGKAARAVQHVAIAHLLNRMGRKYEAWAEILAGRAATPGEVILSQTESLFSNVDGRPPEEVWHYIESKAKSPALTVDSSFEYDPAKNELMRFKDGQPGYRLSPGDLASLAGRLAAWDSSKATTAELLGQKFMLGCAGVERAKNLQAMVELGVAHEDCATMSLFMLGALPGDKSAALPLITHYLPARFPSSFSPREFALREALIALGGGGMDIVELAQASDDSSRLLACMASLHELPEITPEVAGAALALEGRMSAYDNEYTQYLEMLAREKTHGIPALRDLMGKRPTWALRIGAILAERGDFSALDAAVDAYNHRPAPADIWSIDRRELSKAVEILSLSDAPGLYRRLTYRQDLPMPENAGMLQGLAAHPDAQAWPLAEAFYQQHCKGNTNLQAGWFASLLAALGDKRAVPLLREMAPHGNMGISCACALDDLLYPEPATSTQRR